MDTSAKSRATCPCGASVLRASIDTGAVVGANDCSVTF